MTFILESMQTTTLAELVKGVTATVIGFATRDGDDDAVRKLLALGIAPGDRVRVLANGHACLFEIGSARYALDHALASIVVVSEGSTPH